MALTSVARDAKLKLIQDTLANADSELSQAKPNVRKLRDAFDILVPLKALLDADQKADALALRARINELAEELKPSVESVDAEPVR